MAGVPIQTKFADIGKEARDLLSKNYQLGSVKLEGSTKSKSGFAFTTDVNATDSGKVAGSLEIKLPAKYNATMTEKWNTDNVIKTNVAIADQPLPGVKAECEVSFTPTTGKKEGKLKTTYKCPGGWIHSTHDVELDPARPVVHLSAVTGYKGWLLGGSLSYDVSNQSKEADGLAIAYQGEDFAVHATAGDWDRFDAGAHHKVSDSLQWAAALGWKGTGSPSFSTGINYAVDADSTVKAKVDNSLVLGLSYITNVSDGVKATMSASVNATDLNAGGHKIGLGLNLSA